MKNKLLLICGILALGFSSSGQVPEYLYYKFEDSVSVYNYASDPKGDQNIPLPSNLHIDTTGFSGSWSLAGNANPSSGGVQTDFYPDYSKSFTIAFWYANKLGDTELKCYYLFGDDRANFHCIYTANGSSGFVTIYGEGGLGMNFALVNNPSRGSMIHIVYDATPTLNGSYGTYTMYADGLNLFGGLPVTSPPYNESSGLSIGSAPVDVSLIQPTCPEVQEDIAGNIDEFRWYDRALTSTEIMNTVSADLLPVGECALYSHFRVDSISGKFARVNWVPGTGNDAFFLEYGSSGFSRGSGTTISGSDGGSQPPVLLNNLSAGTQYDIYFGEYCNGGTDSVYNPRPVTFQTTPLCPTPSEIEMISGAGFIEVNWKHNGPFEEFYLIYGFSDFDPSTSGTWDTVSSLPYRIAGLSPGTRYDVYVQTACGITFGNSVQVKRSTATECEIKVAPYFEDFNDSTWIAGSIFSVEDTVNVCWTRTDRNSWKVMESSLSGPGFGRGGSGKFLGTPDLGGFGHKFEIYSPVIDVHNLNSPYLSFYYHRHNFEQFGNADYAQPDFKMEVNDGNGWVEIVRLERYTQAEQDDSYQKTGADLTPYGDTIQIRLVAENITDGLAAVMGFDDLSIDEAPACPDIFDVSVETYGPDTSLILNIHSTSANHKIEWGPGRFEQGTGCTKVSSIPVILDDCISPNSLVSVYIKECETTTWAGPFELCGPYTAPYYTGFSGEDSLSREVPCWDIYSSGKGASGDKVSSENNRTRSFSGPNSLRLFNLYQSADDTLLAITPAFIDLPEGGKQIRFMAYIAEGIPLDNDHIIVGTISDILKGNTFEPIDTIHLKRQWKEYVVNFDLNSSLYNGIDNRIALKSGNGLKSIYIDDFYYEETPSCPAPLQGSLGARDEWYDAATVSWEKYTAAQSRVSWGIPGYVPASTGETGTVLTAGTSYRIQGLSPNTSYEFYVQSDCGADKSNWIGPYTFKTICTPVIAPFSENFDGSTWTPAPPTDGIGPFGPITNWSNRKDTLDPCWRRNIPSGTEVMTGRLDVPSYYHTWGVTQQSVYRGESGPLSDHSDTGNYIFPVPRSRIDLGYNIPDTGDIYLPLIDISALAKPYLSFFYHRFTMEDYMPDVLVQANAGNGWITLDVMKGIQHSSAGDPFYQKGISLAGIGDTIRLRFRSLFIGAPAVNLAFNENGVSAIDNIKINEAPPCFEPHDLRAHQEVDLNSGQWIMNLSWENSNVSVNRYEVTYGLPGSDPDSLVASGIVFSTQDASLFLDTLNAACYEFFVRSICVSGDTSSFSTPLRFCVNCRPAKAPFLETFNFVKSYGGDMLPCWDRTFSGNNASTAYSWEMGELELPMRITGPEEDIDGQGYFTYINCRGNDSDTAELYSPMVDISDLDKPEMYFAYHMFGADIDTLHVDIFDGIHWYEDVVNIVGEQHSSATEPWMDTTFKLDNYRNTDLIQLRFRSIRSGEAGRIALDNFRISDTMSCPFPMAFRMTKNTDSTAILKWESNLNVQDFIVEYGLLGYEYGQGTEIVVSSDSVVIPVTDNRLYEAYVKSICGAGDSSLLSGPVSFQSRVVPCDDFEVYRPGHIEDQSSLVKSWDGGATGFSYKGDEEISSEQSRSGDQSLHIYAGEVHGGSSVAVHFEEISTGMHSVDFSFLVPDTGGGAYNFMPKLGKREDYGCGLFYFDQQTGICEIIHSRSRAGIGSFSYTNNWNDISHIVDFDHDTAWIVLNGVNLNIGWEFLDPQDSYSSLDAIHFLTTPDNLNVNGNFSEFFVDDFCISPYDCPVPSELTLENTTCATASLRWTAGQEGSEATLEYGVSGFARGSGDTVRQTSDSYKLTGLTPGETYDVYIEEVCGLDTVFTGPVTFTLPTEAIADFTYTQSNPTDQDMEVNFDGSASVAAEGYTWDFGDGSTGSGAAPKHTYTANGTYSVQLIIESDCGDDTITKTVEISGIDLAENILEESLEIYPNPFTDRVLINFETQNSEDAFLQLSDLSGKAILKQSLKDGNGVFTEELDLGHLAKGTYLLKVSSGDVNAVRRLIKE